MGQQASEAWLELDGVQSASAIAGRAVQAIHKMLSMAANNRGVELEDYRALFHLAWSLTQTVETLARSGTGELVWFLNSLEMLVEGDGHVFPDWIALPAYLCRECRAPMAATVASETLAKGR